MCLFVTLKSAPWFSGFCSSFQRAASLLEGERKSFSQVLDA